jgi:hypothetical protein
MTAALSDGGFERHRATRAPSIQGIPKLAPTLGLSAAVQNSILSPVCESMAVREPDEVHFIEIDFSGIATFGSLCPKKSKYRP